MVLTTMSIEQLIENFALFDSWEDRYQYVIDLGKSIVPLPSHLKTDEYKVSGCTSQVWFVPDMDSIKKGIISFQGESDAFIVSGLIAILQIIYNGKSVEEAKTINMEEVFKTLGLETHLSHTRRNGFFSMIQKIRSWVQ